MGAQLSLDSAFVVACSTVVLVLITAYYAWVTHRLLGVTRSQNFSVTFFQLLEAHRSVTAEIATQTVAETIQGQEAFRFATGEILGGYLEAERQGSVEDPRALIDQLYTNACHTSVSDFSPYFRTLFYLLRFIRDSGLSDRAKDDYAAFVRARMSVAELEVSLSNALSTFGDGGFARLAKDLNLFMGMRLDHPKTEQMLVLFRSGTVRRAA